MYIDSTSAICIFCTVGRAWRHYLTDMGICGIPLKLYHSGKFDENNFGLWHSYIFIRIARKFAKLFLECTVPHQFMSNLSYIYRYPISTIWYQYPTSALCLFHLKYMYVYPTSAKMYIPPHLCEYPTSTTCTHIYI
jgi:hypothetical protein